MSKQALTLADAKQLDANDVLSSFQSEFYIPSGTIYLDGNSLGLMSRASEAAVIRALADWRELAIDGWTKASSPWFTLPERLGAKSASLVGAFDHEVVVASSTTANLHTLLATFYQPDEKKHAILCDSENFPSDLYAVDSHVRLHGLANSSLRVIRPREDGLIHTSDIVDSMTNDVAVILLPSVWYKSGQLADIPTLTQAAHTKGIIIGFDLCHSAGVVPHRLHDWEVDFAVWCNYKYINGGPGSTASLYVHERHHGRLPGLAGWFGSDKDRQFDMAFVQTPAPSAGRWQLGTPPILSTVPIEPALDIILSAGIDSIREKSTSQTEFLTALLDQRVIEAGLGGRILSPRDATIRGGHVAFAHEEAVRVGKALRSAGVIPDFRPPDVLRFAPIPLYTSYEEIWNAVEILVRILRDRTYEAWAKNRDVVS